VAWRSRREGEPQPDNLQNARAGLLGRDPSGRESEEAPYIYFRAGAVVGLHPGSQLRRLLASGSAYRGKPVAPGNVVSSARFDPNQPSFAAAAIKVTVPAQ